MKRIAFVVAAALLTVPGVAQAAFPGENGKIAFVSGGSIWTMNSDGSGRTQLNTAGSSPAWSPNGQRLAYQKSDGVHLVNADGSGDSLFVANASQPAWGPAGDKLAVVIGQPDCPDTRVVRLDGTVEASYGGCDPDTGGGIYCCVGGPAFRPDGNGIVRHWQDMEVDPNLCEPGDVCREEPGPPKIGQGLRGADANWNPNASEYAIHSTDWGSFWTGAIEVLSADGSQILRQLTPSTSFDTSPAWSPDGSKVAFERSGSIYVMNASDGSGVMSLGSGGDPDWQPILRGYARPKGATPVYVPLVPAAKACTAPNTTHGAPLSSGSCSPPSSTSSNVTVSFGELYAKSIASVRLKVVPGTAGPPDDTDVSFNTSITNVMKVSDGSDYTGELRLELPLRITDSSNSPAPPGGGGATVSDTSVFATVPCTATPDTTLGARCALSSTIDALVPGAVQEASRAIWALGQIKVHDGGADGDADTPGDNQPFEVQGVFVP